MASFIHKPHRKAVLLVAGAVALVLLGVAVGFVVLLSGAYSTAATTQHFKITHRILDMGLRYSVRGAARDVAVPPLDAPGMLERGVACYSTHCAQCHGAPGRSSGDAAKGLLPIPNSLAQSAREWPAAWLYYVTREGVRMTGMPAWEYRLSDQSLWSTVAFLKQLPFMTSEHYDRLEARVSGESCEPAWRLPSPYSKERAKVVLRQYACHTCHRIEGVIGPKSYTGPALVSWSRRKYIAGVVPNTYENLVRWIREPQAVSRGTMMPNLGVADAHAHEMATYLMALR